MNERILQSPRSNGNDATGKPPTTLTEEAYRRLEEMIVTLELAPGAVVSEAILSRQLGIGTTPIREALQRLAREYLVQILPRRGVVVTAIDVRQQLELLEVRREIERLIVRLAARRASASERREFGELAERMQAVASGGDPRSLVRLDDAFNRLAARAARNQIAANCEAALQAVSRRFWFFHRELDDLPTLTMLHVAIMRAIEAGDEAAAVEASDRLIDHVTAFTRATLPGA